jgi:hypothetical protein
MNSGITLERYAASSSRPRPPALMRSVRDSPEPFSMTSSGRSSPRAASQDCTARVERS